MKAALAFMLLLFSPAAFAQAPQVTRIDIVDYGIYTQDIVSSPAAPGDVAGTTHTVANIHLVTQTRTIPAQKSLDFGYRYLVVGTPADAVITLDDVVIFPSPMVDPATGRSGDRSELVVPRTLGKVHFSAYGLDKDWQILPGVWTFQLWYQGSKLAEQSFTVQNP
jgi:uncharacterized protein DUF3859